jgi:hypothetical protein
MIFSENRFLLFGIMLGRQNLPVTAEKTSRGGPWRAAVSL